MKNSKPVYKFLDDLNNQLYVPPFQRNYSWTDDEYIRLWEDVIELNPNEELDTHFINTIIHKPQNNNPSKVGDDLLVDGQQRLTTIMLLYAAICSYCKHHEGANTTFDWKEQIYYSVLVNRKGKDDHKLKMRLRGEDDAIFSKIVLDLPAGGQLKDKNCRYHNNNNRILRCFNAYYRMLNEDNIDLIYSNLIKLEMYDGEAEPQDDPQELFDSLNSTGLPLKQFEQIRNYLLMSFDEDKQCVLYETYWKPMEDYFTNKDAFNKFMHGYVRSVRPFLFSSTTAEKIYISLKRHLRSFNIDKEDCIKDIYNCFNIYQQIKEINVDDPNYYFIKGISATGSVNSSYAILFKCYQSLNKGLISDGELSYCLELFANHLLKVRIAKTNSTALNTKIDMGILDYSDFCNSFEKMMFSAHKKITDRQFKEHILFTDFYNNMVRSSTRNILERIEMSFYSKGSVNFERYSIEHIMPQTLTKEWEQQLGKNAVEIHNNYINDIGNLTLTAYNTEYSNETFEEKLEMENGFKDDRLHLNKSVIKYNHWNEDTIKSRTEYLADRMVKVFSYNIQKPKKKDHSNQVILQGGK